MQTGMTPPRQIRPGQPCFVTVRAVNRSFRFVPTRTVCDVITYCLAVALAKYRSRIAVHEFLWMSNHYHLVLSDVDGCLPKFMEELNSLLARALNALHGIQGTAIEKGYNLVVTESDSKVVEHCVYTLANPCRAHLVKRSRQWQSVSSTKLGYGVSVKIRRPKCGLWGGPCRHIHQRSSQASKRARFGDRSRLPEEVELVLARPPIMPELSDAKLRHFIRERLEERERAFIEERRRRRITVMGWSAARKIDVCFVPRQTEERFGRVPSYSGSSKSARIDAWKRRQCFLERYYDALRRFLGGDREVMFPAGTWLMKVRFGVPCCPLPET